MKKILPLLICLAFLASIVSCGGRVPPPKTAQSMTYSFFKRYGKKYKTSLFGTSPVQRVEIQRVAEQSLNNAEVEAFVGLSGGEVARVFLTTKKTPPFGWSVTSWELVDLR